MKRTGFILLIVVITGCEKDHLFDCLKGSGERITVERGLAYFHSIEMHDKADVIYYTGTPRAIITGGANLVNGIETTVTNGWLIVRNKNRCNWVRDFNKRITIEVFSDSLIRVDNYGSGNFTSADTVYCTDFRFDNWNATGQITLKMIATRFYMNIHTGTVDITGGGRAEVQLLYYNGYGKIDLFDLNAYLIYINNSGSGDMFIAVRDELYPAIEESGNIFYKGNPVKIEPRITGTGKLIKAD